MVAPNTTKICQVCGASFYVRPSHISKGKGKFCSKACQRNWHHAPLEERFKRCIGPKNENGCILWNAGGTAAGYGTLHSDDCKKTIYAHRYAWERINGPIPEGLDILHSCDNPGCINPDHLTPGTHAQNMADSVSRDRHARGERNGHAKLSDKEILEIRTLYAEGKLFQKEIAAKFGIDQGHVSHIVNGQAWKHIK